MKQFTSKKKDEESVNDYNDEIDFDQYFRQIKHVLFKLFTYYNKKVALVPVFLIYFLDVVQFLQTIFYIINPDLGLYPQNGIVVQAFTQVLSYLNTFTLIKQNQGQDNFLLVVIAFLFLMISVGLVYYSYLKIVKREMFWELKTKRGANGGFGDSDEGSRSKIQTFLLNLCIGIMLLIHTVLTIPLYNIIIPSFYCTSQSQFTYSFSSTPQCYDLSHIVAILMCLVSIMTLIVIKVCCLTLFYQRNPFKSSIFTCDDNMGLLSKRLIVIAIVIYYVADPLYTLLPLYIGGLVAIYGGYLFLFRWQKIGFYNKRYMGFTQTLQVLLLCFSLNNLVQYFIPTDTDMGVYLMEFIFCSIVISYCSSAVLESYKQSLMKGFYNNPQMTKKGGQVQVFWIQLINYLYHEKDPKRRRVNLKLLLKQLDLEEGSKIAQQQPEFVQTVKNLLSSKLTLTLGQEKLIILQYLRIVLEQIIQQKQAFIFSGCRCSILYEEGYKTKSLCEIYKLQNDKLSSIDEFFLEEIRQRNSQGVMDGEQSSSGGHLAKPLGLSNANANNQQLDEQKIVVYEQYISLICLLQAKINTCLTANVQFWNQLLQEKPDFVYSKKLAKKILFYHQQILSYYQNIQSLFANSIKTKFLFYSYLQTLQWSQTHTQDILEFLQQNQYNLQQKTSQKLVLNNFNIENFHINFDENEKIVMIELDFDSYEGYIKNTNSQVFNFLGYTKNQLIGRKIDKLLPSPIAAKHSQFVENFMNRKESISRSSERIVCAVHKNKFLVPGFLTIKVIYSQQKGMKLIAFIRPLHHQPRTFGILTHSEDTIIVGVTKQITTKVRDREFIAQMSNESVYMELLFPRLKFQRMVPDKVYETEMTTFNNLEREFMQEKNVKVSVRYQQNNYQQNLHFRYYFVTYQQKVQPKLFDGKNSNRSSVAHSLQTRSEFPSYVTSLNTSNIIDVFKSHREDERKNRMEQLCIFKQNYLNKYSNSKYLVCMLMFLAVFGGVITLSVMVYGFGDQFQSSVLWTKERIMQLSILAKDVSVLQTKWIAIYQIKNDSALSSAKEDYKQLSDHFQQNMLTFKSFTTVSDSMSLFNLRVFQQASVDQHSRLRQVLNFQASSLMFQQISLVASLDPTQLQYLDVIRNKLLNETANLLQIYIDNELNANLKMNGFYDSIQQTKFYYSMGIIAVQIGFLILTYMGLYHMKEYVEKNIELIHFLTFYQIRSITQSINDYIKAYLSSQLQAYEPSIFTDSQKHTTSPFLPMQLKLHNRQQQTPSEKPFMSEDENSLYHILKQNEEKLKSQSDEKDGSNNKVKLPPKDKKKKRQSEKISPLMHELAKNVQIQRSGTETITKVPPNNQLFINNNTQEEQNNNRNRKLSTEKNANNLSIQNSMNRLMLQNSGDQGGSRGGMRKYRRSSFGRAAQVMQLNNSAMQISVEQSKSSQKRIMERNSNQKQTYLEKRNKQQQQQLTEQQIQILRRKENKISTLKQATIELEYPNRVWLMLMCVVVIGVFVGAKQLLYMVEGTGEEQMVNYGDSMNNLVKLDSKLMYLRSFILPYYMNMIDPSSQPIITNQTLFAQVFTIQQYISLIYTDLLSNQQVLKSIYRDITFYIYLLQTYPSDSKYLTDFTTQAPSQLVQGITRVLSNLLSRHEQLMNEIAIIDSYISQNNQSVHLYYILQISISIVLSLIIFIVQYYLLIWKLKADEEATFWMIQFIPLQIINGNKNILRTIKRQSAKE